MNCICVTSQLCMWPCSCVIVYLACSWSCQWYTVSSLWQDQEPVWSSPKLNALPITLFSFQSCSTAMEETRKLIKICHFLLYCIAAWSVLPTFSCHSEKPESDAWSHLGQQRWHWCQVGVLLLSVSLIAMVAGYLLRTCVFSFVVYYFFPNAEIWNHPSVCCLYYGWPPYCATPLALNASQTVS